MIGKVGIGSDFPIVIQSMTNIKINDVDGNVKQISDLITYGCEIVRLAVPKPSDVHFFERIKNKLRSLGIKVPLVADVHFVPRVAYDCLQIADKVRINAGNFAEKLTNTTDSFESMSAAVVVKFSHFFESAKMAKIPVRVGVNAGSLSSRILEKFGNTARGMWESAHECIVAAQNVDFKDLILSFKASDVHLMIDAYRLACNEMNKLNLDYPLHLGVTEAGNNQYARVKSAVGIGSLLIDGIGDTIRVSLTEDPVHEISVARDILQSIGARQFGPEFIACPSCGRTCYDIKSVLNDVKLEIEHIEGCKNLKIAVMGCIVNGLGEASNADYTIVGMPNGSVAIYKNDTCIVQNIEPKVAAKMLKDIVLKDFKSNRRDLHQ